jgi:hypothetical protein
MLPVRPTVSTFDKGFQIVETLAPTHFHLSRLRELALYVPLFVPLL